MGRQRRSRYLGKSHVTSGGQDSIVSEDHPRTIKTVSWLGSFESVN